MFNILVVEDDVKMNQIYCSALKRDYNPIAAFDGRQALEIIAETQIDLLISDIMMPGIDGYELTKQLRSDYPEMPILMISAKETFEDKRHGFLAGIDDYMVKPVDLNEMLLRRAKSVSERQLTIGSTVLKFDAYTAEFNGRCVDIPQKEFLVLYKLMSCTDRTFTRRQLMDEIWGMDCETGWETVTVHVGRLRKRFENWEEFSVESVRGLGYRAVKKE